ncbi:exodeoxyribonuclease V subunit alpha [Salinimonas lutimaris]|uniref:exodeoxyribonuclease V subunit alpha n=1 Tax=Salinimonas lutimaris TaxID=914153 RepID=UPI0015862087|nr:exodeoxyribonuclease V subunit alpha [Salinimonas lutimaris]
MKYNEIPTLTKELAEIESIDVYFAQQFCTSGRQNNEIWFMLLIALSFVQRKGHTCLDLRFLASQTLFDSEEETLKGYAFGDLNTLLHACTSAISDHDLQSVMMLDDTRLFTRRYWKFEQQICNALASRTHKNVLDDTQYQKLKSLWPLMFNTERNKGQDWQQVATAAALVQNFTIINGGPGTGKTYTVTRLLLALKQCFGLDLNIQLAAPTGKAAQRMNESVGAALEKLRSTVDNNLISSVSADALTLHRLLGIQRFGVQTLKGPDSPLPCDVLIVDEASMIDTALMARLVRALKPGCKLILVGDADQLPAVESGSVLESLISLQKAGTASEPVQQHLNKLCPHLPELESVDSQYVSLDFVRTLTISQRFKGALSRVATCIKNDQAEQAWQGCPEFSDADMTNFLHNEQTFTLPESYFCEVSEKLIHACFSSLKNIDQTPQQVLQVLTQCKWLTPVRKGPSGVDALNQRVEKTLFQAAANQEYYPGRPIMVVENNYAQHLFNGDTGVIWPDSKGQLLAWFETADGVRAVSLSRLPKVETVFAMTVHKSQGSEFSQVLIFLPEATTSQMSSLLSRELLYTGITRAKRGCILVGSKTSFEKMVATQVQRHSGLAQLFHDFCN